MTLNFDSASWINPPRAFEIGDRSVCIATQPDTDFWQRSYYGFQHDNAPAMLMTARDNFTFTARASFQYQARFDQCGLIVYLDSDNWFKVSIEHEDASISRLGSVVTNLGYSDWATTDIASTTHMWYRLSRRGPDFLIETSDDGTIYKQMRIFHLHALGATTEAMGRSNPPLAAEHDARFGVYACSPLNASFEARFDALTLEPSTWLAHA